MIRQKVAGCQNALRHVRVRRELRGVFGVNRAKVLSNVKEECLCVVFFQNRQDLVGVSGMRTVIEGENYAFWRKIVPIDLSFCVVPRSTQRVILPIGIGAAVFEEHSLAAKKSLEKR